MPYPAIRPTGRSFDPGNWPVRTYNSQSGAEVRLLYGSKRYNLKLSLTYTNISDAEAAQFLAHYEETRGTFSTFAFDPAARVALFSGWQGGLGALSPPLGVDWRYAEPPRIDSVRPGISTATVSLVGVI
jgi:hypothetical protein